MGTQNTRKDTDFFDKRTQEHIFVTQTAQTGAETLRNFATLREATTLRKAFV